MRYEHCRVRHEPPHTYGDCLRACIASIMDVDASEVPHFADHGVTGDQAMQIMREWMVPQGVAPFIVAYPGDIAMADLREMMRVLNPESLYILFGGTDAGDHCVVCRGGQIIHNPAWADARIVGPTGEGTWQVLVVGRV